MDAGVPVVVFAPTDESGHRTLHSGIIQDLRTPTGRPVLLAVELGRDAGNWDAYHVIPVRFAALSAELLAMLGPEVVAIPLWSRSADAIQVLTHLVDLGYSGQVEVHGPHLPNRGMVMRELSQAGAGLRIRLLPPPDQG